MLDFSCENLLWEEKMECCKECMEFYAVTDRAWLKGESLLQSVEKAILGGVTMVQLREKDLDYSLFLQSAKELKELCKKYNVPLIINDNLDIALESGADGIHIGQSDMELKNVVEKTKGNMIVGVSVRTLEEAIIAEKNGASYLGVGAVFSTSTKLDAKIVDHNTVKEICENVNIPVVAIGGINKNNIKDLSGLGLDGVALVSAIFNNIHIEEACKKLSVDIKEMLKIESGRNNI